MPFSLPYACLDGLLILVKSRKNPVKTPWLKNDGPGIWFHRCSNIIGLCYITQEVFSMLFRPSPESTPRIRESILTEAMFLARKKARSHESAPEPLGAHLARLRKERGMTQIELADKLGVSQPVVSDYERGTLRLHGQLIVKLTDILGVPAEELLGLEKRRANGTPNRRLLRRIQEIEQLPRRDQQALLRTIDRFLESFRAE